MSLDSAGKTHGRIRFIGVLILFVVQVYSPGASEEMMSHPGDGIPQSHYSPKGGLYADAYYMGKSYYE